MVSTGLKFCKNSIWGTSVMSHVEIDHTTTPKASIFIYTNTYLLLYRCNPVPEKCLYGKYP